MIFFLHFFWIFEFFEIFWHFQFFGFFLWIFFLSFLIWDFLRFFGRFWIFGYFGFIYLFIYLFIFLNVFRGLLKVTEVTTEHKKWPKVSQNSIKSSLFARRTNKALAGGQSSPQELEVKPAKRAVNSSCNLQKELA